ncbi:MAG TPA: glycosyltransferase [Gammaproteobacteria bacterium]|nr:glycosyltransferase [Gammaproteobacteria bacterium]
MSIPRPQVSAILLCYNRSDFVVEALHSAFGQDCPAMQLIVSDDASTDETANLVAAEVAAYDGPHRVEFRHQPDNSGSKSAHLNRVFPLARGEIIVSFDDDDISRPDRVSRILAAFSANPRAYAVYSAFASIDASGHTRGHGNVPHPPPGVTASRWFARVDAYAAGTTLAIRRRVMEVFDELDPGINEDVVLPFRASLLGDVVYLDEELVRARRHGGSLTSDLDIFRSIERYRKRFLDGIERARRHRDMRLADLKAAGLLMPERLDEWQSLERVVTDSLADAESTAGLVSPSVFTRLGALLQQWRRGSYPEDRGRNLALALAPGAYLRRKRRSLQARGSHVHTGRHCNGGGA